MAHFVYLLKSKKNDKFYVGYTTHLKKRLAQHNAGNVLSTKGHIPYEMVYFEGFANKTDALIREKKLKHHGQGLRRLKDRLTHTLQDASS